MAWGKCPTHGPIQDARVTAYGDGSVLLFCSCGLECEHYEPQSFVEHDELKELATTGKQPRADHEVPDSPKPKPKRKASAKPKPAPDPDPDPDEELTDGDADASDD